MNELFKWRIGGSLSMYVKTTMNHFTADELSINEMTINFWL